MKLTLEEQMALAVLKGGKECMAAARALADSLLEKIQNNERQVIPCSVVNISSDNVRVALFVKDDYTVSEEGMQRVTSRVRGWLQSGGTIEPLILTGIERIEIYQIEGGG